ncbi:polymorphic toxin-type HINT domain-containing protein [Kitasatospora cineracea]|uniref:Intein n=1 Tax=Kitasatospora cineracea TaxID=88074 RepID=A0A3N4R3D4_9ACTN|nr:polymorphic toxin-type HINT domain-containing protein [Kitasatospora cineracea]RPE27898.1 intein [Kitasatospora cineracea]
MVRWLCRGVLPLALMVSLVSATPVAADTAPTGPVLTDRGRVLQAWKDGGTSVQAAAEEALTGGGDKVAAFLVQDGEWAKAEAKDNEQALLQIVVTGGPALRKAAAAALDSHDKAAVAAFLDHGWKAPLEQDQRVRVSQLVETGGPATKAAGLKALDGSIDDVGEFLTHKQDVTRESDARVRVSQLVETGGPATKQAGMLALEGSLDDITEFLAVGQHIAAARDREYADVAQLAQQAKETSDQAEREKDAALEAADQAVTGARLAREAAEKARSEAEAAQGDSAKAAAAAKRAAEAGRQAAVAAKAAITAAQAANTASRLAAAAAQQAASAAAGADQAAGRALTWAAQGKVDEQAAKAAEQAAGRAQYAADAADRAAGAAVGARDAARAAFGALNDLALTTLAANQANDYANAAGAYSEEAKQAAASSQRHAAEAQRSANKAADLADQSATAAREAAAAARSAATHAANAAEAARNSTLHAGNATNAAQRATAHAASAAEAANSATAAVNKAVQVHQLALASEQEEREARKATGTNQARDLKAAFDLSVTEADKAKTQALALDQTAAQLAAQAAQAGADTVVANGRKMALAALKTRGSWSKSAAEYALTGSDQAVIDYVRSGWTASLHQDEILQAEQLADNSEFAAVRTAATNALATSDPAQVHTFLTTGRHQVALDEYRVKTSQILETGGPALKAAAQAALEANTADALTTFLTRGQYTAKAADDQVKISQLLETGGDGGGEEVKLAAAIAIESPSPAKSDFLTTGRYRAKQQDDLTRAHEATITNTINTASQTAALAQQNAALAAKAAADANNAADQANQAAADANKYANAAAGYATDAQKSATAADTSATQARTSAAQAKQAAAQAQVSAFNAQDSARRAAGSATAARGSADTAYAAVAAARQSAENAHQSSENAAAISDAAQAQAIAQAQAEDAYDVQQIEAFKTYMKLRQEAEESGVDWNDVLNGMMAFQKYVGTSLNPEDYTNYDRFADMMHTKLDIIGLVPGVGEAADLINCLWTGGEYLADYASGVDFGLSCFSMIPIAGWASAGAKFVKKFGKKALDGVEAAWGWVTGAKKAAKIVTKICTRNSFPAGTLVLMGDGTTKPIEQIKTGDSVQATDPRTGESGPHRVEATIYTPDDLDFTELTVTASDKSQQTTVTATDHHPFWTQSTTQWTDAGDIRPGDTLRTDTGATAQVTSVRHWTALQPAYNLTVADLHTYYVLAGTTPVLTHNEDICNAGLGRLIDVDARDPAADALAKKIGGRPSVKFEKDSLGKEYDVISDKYIAESKPAGMKLGSDFRKQMKQVFEKSIMTGRTPYFHFEGPPTADVIRKIQEYAQRYGIEPVVDISPLE